MKLSRGSTAGEDLVRDLQTDLRKLGYLRAGLDGRFGRETERAVRALRTDLLVNDGRGPDGAAPIALKEFNRGRIELVSGVVDEALASCIEELLDDVRCPKLPFSDDPAGDNRRALEAIRVMQSPEVPIPILLAIMGQESNFLHFRVPTTQDRDNFIVVGLDRNESGNDDRITSRGYGIGQYTLFHHPPTSEEVAGVMLDPVANVKRAVAELKDKFEHFVNGPTAGSRADDRLAEIGRGELRLCRYPAGDERYLMACRQCAATVARTTIGPNSPLFEGSAQRFKPTTYHPEVAYDRVPNRKELGCDWPYAVRRYNGSGVNSFHYQAQVLLRLVEDPTLADLLG